MVIVFLITMIEILFELYHQTKLVGMQIPNRKINATGLFKNQLNYFREK